MPKTPSYRKRKGYAQAPVGLLNALTKSSLLEELSPIDLVACDGCPDAHMLDVDLCEYPTGTTGMAKCPACGRVEVPLDRLRQW